MESQQNMFKNQLIALEHPFADSVDGSFQSKFSMIFKRIILSQSPQSNIDINIHATDDQDFASTVLWLEDQKIRHYKIEDRGPLRNIDNFAEWENAFEKYKTDIGAPKFETRIEDLQWILSYAVRLEYMDRVDEYKNITGELVNEAKKATDPTTSSKNPFDSMDMKCEDFEQGVRKLARMLNITHHPDHLVVSVSHKSIEISLIILIIKNIMLIYFSRFTFIFIYSCKFRF